MHGERHHIAVEEAQDGVDVRWGHALDALLHDVVPVLVPHTAHHVALKLRQQAELQVKGEDLKGLKSGRWGEEGNNYCCK